MAVNQPNKNIVTNSSLDFADKVGQAIPVSKTSSGSTTTSTSSNGLVASISQNDAYSTSPLLASITGQNAKNSTEVKMANLGISNPSSESLASTFTKNLDEFTKNNSKNSEDVESSTVNNSTTGKTKGNNAEKADTSSPLSVPNQFGKVKGMLSIPAPGAHVWVMFENGDPNYPIVIGTIYGAQDYQGIHDIPEEGTKASSGTSTSTDGTETTSLDTTSPETSATNNNTNASGDSVQAADNWQKKIAEYKKDKKSEDGVNTTGLCWTGVKKALDEGGVVNGYMITKSPSASDAGPTLIKNGFTKINVSSPQNAPAGSVLVYSGGKHGHIEMKTSDGGYVSDHYRASNTTLPTRKLIGVYVK